MCQESMELWIKAQLTMKSNFDRRNDTANKRIATLVTTRSHGSSHLNRVELLECGPLKYVHSVHTCMCLHVYIKRVDRCSCGDTSIYLYQGADTSEHLQV